MVRFGVNKNAEIALLVWGAKDCFVEYKRFDAGTNVSFALGAKMIKEGAVRIAELNWNSSVDWLRNPDNTLTPIYLDTPATYGIAEQDIISVPSTVVQLEKYKLDEFGNYQITTETVTSWYGPAWQYNQGDVPTDPIGNTPLEPPSPEPTPNSEYESYTLEMTVVPLFGGVSVNIARLSTWLANKFQGLSGWHFDRVEYNNGIVKVHFHKTGSITLALVIATILAVMLLAYLAVREYRLIKNGIVEDNKTISENNLATQVLQDPTLSAEEKADLLQIIAGFTNQSPAETIGNTLKEVLPTILVGVVGIYALKELSAR